MDSKDVRTKQLIYRMIKDSLKAVDTLPNSRETSLVRTKFDEARMWLREVQI